MVFRHNQWFSHYMKRIRSALSYLYTKTIQRSMSLISYGFWLKNSLFYASCFGDLDALLNFKQNHFTVVAFIRFLKNYKVAFESKSLRCIVDWKNFNACKNFLYQNFRRFSPISRRLMHLHFCVKFTNAFYAFRIKNSQRFFVFHVFAFHTQV